ncbi:hypothetical protein FQR65_LT03793 [Abscondita terminalis]|nr:hypothetical protein FQR65_LT03793 [Abscondita terminalis]
MVGVQHFSKSGLVTRAIPTLNSSSYVELDNSALIVQDEPVNLTMESISSPRPQFDFEVVAGPSHEHKHPDLLGNPMLELAEFKSILYIKKDESKSKGSHEDCAHSKNDNPEVILMKFAITPAESQLIHRTHDAIDCPLAFILLQVWSYMDVGHSLFWYKSLHGDLPKYTEQKRQIHFTSMAGSLEVISISCGNVFLK